MLTLIDNEPVPCITTAQAVTSGWVDLSDVMNLGSVDILNLWVKLTINNSLDVQFRVVAMQTASASDLYSMPITAASSATVAITAETFTLDTDATQLILVPFSLSGAIPYGKIQVKAGTVGVTPASVTSAKVNPIRV